SAGSAFKLPLCLDGPMSGRGSRSGDDDDGRAVGTRDETPAQRAGQAVEDLGGLPDHDEISPRRLRDPGEGCRGITDLSGERDLDVEVAGPALDLGPELLDDFVPSLLGGAE